MQRRQAVCFAFVIFLCGNSYWASLSAAAPRSNHRYFSQEM